MGRHGTAWDGMGRRHSPEFRRKVLNLLRTGRTVRQMGKKTASDSETGIHHDHQAVGPAAGRARDMCPNQDSDIVDSGVALL